MPLTRGERTALLWTLGFLAFGGLIKAHQSHEVRWGKAFLMPPPKDSLAGGALLSEGVVRPDFQVASMKAGTILEKDSLPAQSSQLPTLKGGLNTQVFAVDAVPPSRSDEDLKKNLGADSARKGHPTQGKAGQPESCPVAVNEASVDQLTALPGVGPSTAGKMVAYRAQHGPFRKLSDLDKVKGIGQKKLDRMKACLIL